LISGPPGTGKTKTIVEIALQLTHNPSFLNAHILLCAPSDSAADILIRRLKEHLSIPQLLRLNAASRPIGEVPIDLLGYCYIDGETNLFLLPDFKQLMSYKIVVTTCRDADLLVQARVTNRDLVQLEKGILDALHSDGQNNLGSFLHWTALLVDEAAQAMEPEVAIPLSVVAPPATGGIGDVLVVMAGDQGQLGPRTSSRDANLEKSLFERLFDRPLYRDHPLARKRAKARDWNPSTRTGLMVRPPFANLFRNYRSHPAILAVPSALFYHDTLIPEATDVDNMIDWVGWRGRCWPVLFSSNLCDDEIEYDGGGWYNVNEAKKACDYALSLVQSNLIEQRDICIMSPFSAQVKLIRQTIRREPYKLGGVNIGPMEVFQGLESRVVIICTTRTRSRFLAEDRARGLGMINETRRFNVAITRAKQGLIIIGNPWILAQDPAWVALMAFCRRHDLWEEDSQGGDGSVWMPDGAADEEVEKGHSSLERGLMVREEGEGGMDDRVFAAGDEDGMWMAGVVAEEAFGDEF
jgi:helicase MOV-10